MVRSGFQNGKDRFEIVVNTFSCCLWCFDYFICHVITSVENQDASIPTLAAFTTGATGTGATGDCFLLDALGDACCKLIDNNS